MRHTIGELSWNNVFFCVFSVAVMELVLRLAVKGNSISDLVVRRHRVPVYEGHRYLSTASR
jgi:hypothetical protein